MQQNYFQQSFEHKECKIERAFACENCLCLPTVMSPNNPLSFQPPHFHTLLLELKYAISALQRSSLNFKHNMEIRKIAIKKTATEWILIHPLQQETGSCSTYSLSNIEMKATAERSSYFVHICNKLKQIIRCSDWDGTYQYYYSNLSRKECSVYSLECILQVAKHHLSYHTLRGLQVRRIQSDF